MKKRNIWIVGLFLIVTACKSASTDVVHPIFQLLKISSDFKTLILGTKVLDITTDGIFDLRFSTEVDSNTIQYGIKIEGHTNYIPFTYSFVGSANSLQIKTKTKLTPKQTYRFIITSDLNSVDGLAMDEQVFEFETKNGSINLLSAKINDQLLNTSETIRDIDYSNISLELSFDTSLSPNSYTDHIKILPAHDFRYTISADSTKVTITNNQNLDYYSNYNLLISSQLTSASGYDFSGYTSKFQTNLNPNVKKSILSDEELLTKIQETTFKYFWDFAHPVSGLARERNTSGELVTIGGSGFGVLAILVGIERGFITRELGIERLTKIVEFLATKADRYHGVWSHWLNGSTGKTIAFSAKDDGADLVETAFMAQGLIAVREYINLHQPTNTHLINLINNLLDEIEWDWFTKDSQDVLYWHWSPNYNWDMNMRISGYNEALIVYILARTSKNFKIDTDVYHNGWARSGAIQNNNSFYGYNLPLGYNYGGPLFFAHYSFLGLNPTKLTDRYANYWEQNRNHSLIHYEYSKDNPRGYVGYDEYSWGLTASDTPTGYLAHEPNNDRGTITPTAAISSIPYTPVESMKAIRHFYYVLGDKLWGKYGFYDAFNPTESWWADSYLAIDQGPIVVMIENYRSGLIWDLFMSADEVQKALNELGFTYNN